MRHLTATLVGIQVRARMELTDVEGHKLVFKKQTWDEVELIGEAKHECFVVDKARFLGCIQAKIK